MQRVVEVKRRIRSVQSIGEVCRTLATVASARLSQTRDRAAGVRVYTRRLREIIARQQAAAAAVGRDISTLSPLLVEREPHKIMLIAVGADRGLCGGYNLMIGREAAAFIRQRRADDIEVEVVTKGSRIEAYLERIADASIATATDWTRAGVTEDEIDTLLAQAVDAFLSGRADEVWACYTSFLSTIDRVPMTVRLLPIDTSTVSVERSGRRWYYEPDLDVAVTELLDAFVRLQVEDVLLESYTSEQAARMVTMQEASERADRTLHDLRVRYNRLRRESITSDLLGLLVASRLRKGDEEHV